MKLRYTIFCTFRPLFMVGQNCIANFINKGGKGYILSSGHHKNSGGLRPPSEL